MVKFMKDKVSIRPIELCDLDFVKDVLNEVIKSKDSYLTEYLKSDDDIRKWYYEHQDSDLYAIFVAELDGNLAGWVSLSNFRSIDGYDVSVELSVYVKSLYYRMGVSLVLVQYVEAFAKSKGLVHKIISVITSTNEASIALHTKCGFEVEGVLKEAAKKRGKYQDVVLMSKIIN